MHCSNFSQFVEELVSLLLLIYQNFTRLVWKYLIFFQLVIISYFHIQTIFTNTLQNEWYPLNFIAANCQKVSDREFMQKYLNVYLRLTEFRKKTHNWSKIFFQSTANNILNKNKIPTIYHFSKNTMKWLTK